jgi:hypothetical protein
MEEGKKNTADGGFESTLPSEYQTEYDLDDATLNKIKEKFKKEKDFVNPTTAAEKMFAISMLIEQLTEVRNNQWGKPVKIDNKAIKWLIDESAKIFSSEKMLLEIEAPVKIFGDVHGQYFDLFRLFEIAGYPDGV